MSKKKKCKVCKERFEPFSSLQKTCDIKCALIYVDQQRYEKHKKDIVKRKIALKSKSDWLKETQVVFNKYIRLRDEGLNCISCQKPPKKKNAGHYKTTKAYPELRFEELGCHLQCEHCNTHLSGNISDYRVNLINKIGLEKVEWLEGPHEPKNYTIDDLIELKKEFKRKIKELE